MVRPSIQSRTYFTQGEYDGGRDHARWPEKFLMWMTYWRVRARGAKGGMFFIDRRKVYADQIQNRKARGLADEPQTKV